MCLLGSTGLLGLRAWTGCLTAEPWEEGSVSGTVQAGEPAGDAAATVGVAAETSTCGCTAGGGVVAAQIRPVAASSSSGLPIRSTLGTDGRS